MALTDPIDVTNPRRPSAVAPRRTRWPRAGRALRAVLVAIVAAASVAGVALFAVSSGELWLDEAQSVAIARLPIGDMLDALRHDGAPPLYYLVLHGWIGAFGDSTEAVRALSGVFALASLPAMWLLARRIGGGRAAWAATALLATSPFLIRYSTETRMYSAVVLLVLLGGLALLRAATQPTIARLALVSLATGALLLTHYWAMYLVATVLAALAVEAVRGRRVAARLTAAIAGGGVLFLPWLPSFVFQTRHTGAPWAGPPSLGDLVEQLRAYAGPGDLDSAGWVLWLLLIVAVGLGVFARRRRSGIVEVRWRASEPGRQLGLIAGGTLALALAAGLIVDSPVAARYTAVVFPVFVLLAALGLCTAGGRTSLCLLALASFTGIVGGWDSATTERTEVPRVAAVLDAHAGPDDLVVYCPDQLGPSTSRLLDPGLRQVTFPSLRDPGRVDWVDYQARVDATDIDGFARRVDVLAGTADLWLVTAPNYMTMSDTCAELYDALDDLRPLGPERVRADGRFAEQAQLYRMNRVADPT